MLHKALIILSWILCFSSGAFTLGKVAEIESHAQTGIQRRNGMSS